MIIAAQTQEALSVDTVREETKKRRVLQGRAQVVWMDWISVLHHKHLPSATAEPPASTLHSPGTAWEESLAMDKEYIEDSCCGFFYWKN
ncbi:hypothetical protein INR49_028946 [Caranx melampygus]|nr:hypothetical protein INR49_028946 [Caranx melampygus]